MSSSSFRMPMAEWMSVLCAQKNGKIDCERRLSGSLRRGSKENYELLG